MKINIGDIVFPAYDDKMRRCTRCTVINIVNNKIYVEGVYWDTHNNTSIVGIFKQDENGDYYAWVNEENALMDLIGINDENESGNYYTLYTLEEINKYKKYFSNDYLTSLGLKNE